MQQQKQQSKEWNYIYPVYLNNRKTVQDGRRLPVSKGVDNPTAQEIFEVCKHLGFECEYQPEKAYARDATQRGRVKVKLNKGQPNAHNITSKRELMVHIASLIPKLQSRSNAKQESTSTTSKSNKKGKKK